MRVAVFVHGTGVRGEAFSSSFSLVQRRLSEAIEGIVVRPCYWGGSEGVELKAHGASIPSYDDTGGRDPSEEEENLALWAILYLDAWYELRLMGDWPAASEEMAPGQEPPATVLRTQVQAYEPSSDVMHLLRLNNLDESFVEALTQLRNAPELTRAIDAATETNLNELRKAIARALVAKTSNVAETEGMPLIDGRTRDQLVSAITDDLHGYGLGLAAWLTRPFKGVATHIATRQLGRRRGGVTDSSTPAAGDIMRYQARGSGIRDCVRQAVADAIQAQPDASVLLIGHSLGGIACVEASIEAPIAGVDRLVTVGSQAPYMYEIDALATLPFGEPLPPHFPEWLNVYDRRDFLSYVGAEVFPGRVEDREVDNRQPFPQAHSAYWKNDDVWQSIRQFVS